MIQNTRFSIFLFGIVFVILTTETSVHEVYGIPIDLNKWVQEGPLDNGNWQVDETGSSVIQTVNQWPTMFVSPKGENLIDGTIKGKIQVNDYSDDDWIGFVLGFGESSNDKFIVLDWKKGLQEGSKSGFTLAQADAGNNENLFEVPDNDNDTLFYNHHENKDGWTVIDSNYDAGGWQPGIEYEFTIDYFRDHIIVQVAGGNFDEGQTVLETYGNFPAGRIGFYNHSQESVTYSTFEETLQTEVISPETTSVIIAGSVIGVGSVIVIAIKMGIISTKPTPDPLNDPNVSVDVKISGGIE